MSIGRALGSVAVLLLCGAAVPVGSCAKGCGKAASHGGDDIARGTALSGARYSDDLARGATGYSDDLARGGSRYRGDLARGGARHGDDVVVGGAHYSDDVAGAYHGEGVAGRAAPEIDLAKLELSPKQSKTVEKALDVAKDAAQEALGMLGDEDDANDRDARIKLDRATKELDRKLARTLNGEQLRQFHATYGSTADVITWMGASQPSDAAKP